MTQKRFKLDSEIGFIDTQKCGGDTMTLFEVVVELNKLNEENENLKQNCKNYEWYKQYKAVLNENNQLKMSLTEILEIVLQNDFYRDLMKEAIKELSEEGFEIEEMI